MFSAPTRALPFTTTRSLIPATYDISSFSMKTSGSSSSSSSRVDALQPDLGVQLIKPVPKVQQPTASLVKVDDDQRRGESLPPIYINNNSTDPHAEERMYDPGDTNYIYIRTTISVDLDKERILREAGMKLIGGHAPGKHPSPSELCQPIDHMIYDM